MDEEILKRLPLRNTEDAQEAEKAEKAEERKERDINEEVQGDEDFSSRWCACTTGVTRDLRNYHKTNQFIKIRLGLDGTA